MAKIKITVLKRMFNPDLSNEYALPGNVPCEHFSEGQEFFVRGLAKPEGFCDWAWDDIHKSVMTLLFGGDFSCWMKKGNTIVVCCTDGIRPVVFGLERIDG